MKIVEILLVVLSISGVSGCAKIFKKPGDEPVKSPCEVCKKTPFYVNGERV